MPGNKWEDPQFPADKTSLTYPQDWAARIKEKPKWAQITWERPDKIAAFANSQGSTELFHGDIEPNDVNQGSLGDCWLLSSMSAIAEYPGRIRKMFINEGVDQHGIYGIKFTKNGVERTVFVDDRLPQRENKNDELIFTKTQGAELWATLLEKAWAKVHTNYDRIVGGKSFRALRDLTGAPAFCHDIKDVDPDEVFEMIHEADRQKYIICASSNKKSSTEQEKKAYKALGLFQGHAYAILRAATVEYKNDDV